MRIYPEAKLQQSWLQLYLNSKLSSCQLSSSVSMATQACLDYTNCCGWRPFESTLTCRSRYESVCLQAFAEAESLKFMETSALKNVNVEPAFNMLLSEIYSAATRKIFANQNVEDRDFGGRKVELKPDYAKGNSGLCCWSCCGGITRFMGLSSTAKQA